MTAKSFDEYWVSKGCYYPKNQVSDRDIAHRAWDEAIKSVEAVKEAVDVTIIGRRYDKTRVY